MQILDVPFPDHLWYRVITPHSYHKHDAEGRPLYIERSGAIDVSKVVNIMDADALIARHLWQMIFLERKCAEATTALGRPVERATYIFDLAGLSLSPNSLAMAIFKCTVHVDQAFFPERLHLAFFINSPWIFQGLWAILSPFIDPVTRAKFRILGTDYQDELLKHITPDCLPVEYGGSCECGRTDEPGQPVLATCVSPVCALTAAEMLTYGGYETFVLAAGTSTTRRFTCVPDGNAVYWRFLTDSNDVGFAVKFYADHDADVVDTLVHDERRTTHKGTYFATAAGVLEFSFSNAHSTFYKKTVHVRISGGHSPRECAIRNLCPFSQPKGYAVDDVGGAK